MGAAISKPACGPPPIGKNTLTCIYLRDITGRIRIHDQLQKTNIFLHNIIRSSFDGIVVIDPKGDPLIFSKGAERILGYKAGEVIADPRVFRSFYPIELAREMMRRLRSSEYGPPDTLETTQLTFINKYGKEVPVNLSASIVRDGDREVGSVGIFSDLNPLAGILIHAEILKRDLEENAGVRENLEVIIDQTVRCQQIVTRLLEFSRQSLGQRTLFNLNEVIDRCVDLIRHQPLFHNIEINRDLDPELQDREI
jgi:two-component system NtrC family sensor kinase